MSTAVETFTFDVPAMSCDHCRRAVEEEVAGIAGVVDVVVDLDAKEVVVRGRGLDGAALVAAIDAAGYHAAAR